MKVAVGEVVVVNPGLGEGDGVTRSDVSDESNGAIITARRTVPGAATHNTTVLPDVAPYAYNLFDVTA